MEQCLGEIRSSQNGGIACYTEPFISTLQQPAGALCVSMIWAIQGSQKTVSPQVLSESPTYRCQAGLRCG